MSYLQPEQLTATAYVDDALQDYLFQLQHCTTDPAQAPPPNVDLSALSTIQGNGEAVMSQSDMATLDPHAAQAAAAYNQEGLPSFAEQAMQQDQQQQDMGQQASANGKQSAVWVQRNRKNQKQYRIRQKAQKQQMEEQVEEMAAQIEKLKIENTRIAGRNSTLETVLSFRGSEIANLQHRNQILSADGDPQPFIPAETDSSKGNTAAGAPENADNVIQAYKANVDVMAGLLLKLDQQGSSLQLAQQIRSAVLVSAHISMRAAVLSPDSIMKLMRTNLHDPKADLDTSSSDTTGLEQHWQQVTAILQLRPDQQEVMINLQKHFAQEIADNRKRRRGICRGLQEGTDTMKRYHAAVGTESQKYVATIFEVYAEVQRLRDNLREQHRIWIDFYASVFKVWDHVQHCQAVVHGFPKYPDIVAICNCVADFTAASATPQQ